MAASTSLRVVMKLIGIDHKKICNFSILERDLMEATKV